MEDTQINLMWYLREGKDSPHDCLCYNRVTGKKLTYKWWNVATGMVTFEDDILSLESAEDVFIVEFSGLADDWKEPVYKRALQEYNNRVISSPIEKLTPVINKPKIIQLIEFKGKLLGLSEGGVTYYKNDDKWLLFMEGLK